MLIKINEEKDITFEDFEKKVRLALMSEYWSRCEYETVITSWPPHVDGKEIDRLNKERTEHLEKWGKFYCTDVRLSVGEKIDVFSQITMNWEHFINYLWNNRKLIKKLKKV